MIRKIAIAGGVLGIRQTLREMGILSVEGGKNPYIQGVVRTYDPPEWDTMIRRYWRFTEEREEVLHGIQAQLQMLVMYGSISGDCDDAAILAGALAVAAGWVAQFVAVRSPERGEFDHVFTEVAYQGNWYRIDPTAPQGVNYDGWERLVWPI